MDEQNPLAVLKQLPDNDLPNYPKSKLLVYEDKVIFETIPQPRHNPEKTEIAYEQIDEVDTRHDIFRSTGSIEIKTLDKKSFMIHLAEEKLLDKVRRFINRKISPMQFTRKINKKPLHYYFHHLTINAKDLIASERFYYLLGFKKVFEYKARDDSLTIIHLKNGFCLIEIFSYPSELPPDYVKDEDSYFPSDGIKYFALRVPSVERAKDDLIKKGINPHSEISEGKTGVKHFLIKDPDGVSVEIVQDDRYLEVY